MPIIPRTDTTQQPVQVEEYKLEEYNVFAPHFDADSLRSFSLASDWAVIAPAADTLDPDVETRLLERAYRGDFGGTLWIASDSGKQFYAGKPLGDCAASTFQCNMHGVFKLGVKPVADMMTLLPGNAFDFKDEDNIDASDNRIPGMQRLFLNCGTPKVDYKQLRIVSVDGIDDVFPALGISRLANARGTSHVSYQGNAFISASTQCASQTKLWIFVRKLEELEHGTRKSVEYQGNRYTGMSHQELKTMTPTTFNRLRDAGNILQLAQRRRKLTDAIVGSEFISTQFTSAIHHVLGSVGTHFEKAAELSPTAADYLVQMREFVKPLPKRTFHGTKSDCDEIFLYT